VGKSLANKIRLGFRARLGLSETEFRQLLYGAIFQNNSRKGTILCPHADYVIISVLVPFSASANKKSYLLKMYAFLYHLSSQRDLFYVRND